MGRRYFAGSQVYAEQEPAGESWRRPWCGEKFGSGAWTRTKITSSKGWRATNCTTPETRKHFTSVSRGAGRKVQRSKANWLEIYSSRSLAGWPNHRLGADCAAAPSYRMFAAL